MPREQTLLEPLSGAEIKEIMLAKISQAFDKDCTLVDDVCYAGFTFDFEGKLRYVRSTTPGTLVWGNLTEGEKPEKEATPDTVAVDYETDSPNQAREDNDLPLPVLIQTPSGPKRQKVRFKKPERGNHWKPAVAK